MILSIANAPTEGAESTHMFGIWSDLVVGERPAGLLDCYLVEGDGVVQVAAIWESQEAHDAALEDEDEGHPAYGFFAACGLDPTHTIYRVIGRMH